MKRVPYHELHKLSFDIYRADEIKKLSVLEITNPSSFDALEHPTYGGLYDPHLGPNDQEEQCETCGLQAMYCPGHVGHITLPFPVFNPVFIKTLYQLLQGSCLQCYRLLASTNAIRLALYQFQALDYGLVGVVQELHEAITDPTLIAAGTEGDMSSVYEDKLKGIIERATENIDAQQHKATSQVKSVVECRQRVMKEFIRSHLSTAKRKCCHCKKVNSKVALRNNTTFILVSANVIKKEILENGDEVNRGIQADNFFNIDLTPSEARRILEQVWKKDNMIMQRLFGILRVPITSNSSPVDVFFTDVLLVPPSRFRPISVVKGRKFLNPQSTALKEVLTQSLLLRNIVKVMQKDPLTDVEQDAYNKTRGKTETEKLNFVWNELQKSVNCVYDSDMDKLKKEKIPSGVKQVLEKKEGLFRKHMMGKRVNYAARSVISPDPYIMVDEIGVPIVFAKKLTYPTPVTDWNVEKLRRAVVNGPNVHPGADKVETEDGRVVKLSPTDEVQRYAIACQLLKPTPGAFGATKGIPKKVHRHLQNGDVLLLNRQPTLHKPSIMAHRARVLHGEKTLRLHYANCKSYNADFDGDEMNAHFPQSELARSEGYNIVSVNHQYLVPKDGTPLSGLIQDHIIAGTLLTMRGQFFSREDYQQLVFGAVSFLNKRVKTLPPAMIKPQVLWSGKQVFSTVIINIIPDGKVPPTIEGKTKISGKNWQSEPPREWLAGGSPLHHSSMSEEEVIIRAGHLLCGVIDKANVGPTPYGLIHCCYEVYGGETSTALLTSLARLFTHYLQIHSGFSLGIEDILLTKDADKKRKKVMRKGKKVGNAVVAAAFDLEDENNEVDLFQSFRNAHLSRNDIGLKTLDFEMKKKTDTINNDINGICMPKGLYKSFPLNNLQLMIQSGAKGSTVNAMQISCLLGQIELEGRRVPLMLNGSTLPSFLPYDRSPRAGGFVDGRFLTGIRPQEFFFHCMAGREGLVDTAVKTSRSGYLQRCLIKHLEGIVVDYDLTVRDSDGSVIQFLYGEDGLDIGKMQMLKEHRIDLLAKNYDAIMRNVEKDNVLNEIEDPIVSAALSKEKKKIARFKQKHGHGKVNFRSSGFLNFSKSHNYEHSDQVAVNRNNWFTLAEDLKKKFDKRAKKCPDPVNSTYAPHVTLGSVSEKLDTIIQEYLQANHDGAIDDNRDGLAKGLDAEKFRKMVHYRALRALAQPGEAVGLLAAQSVGEPSTQMTLNTFHFAGRGEMNVTLGIPRLREILMVASANIATPTMDLPLYPGSEIEAKAEILKVKLSAVYLKQVLEKIDVKEVLHVLDKMKRCRRYNVRMQFLPYKAYKGLLQVTPADAINYVEQYFLYKLISALKKKLSFITLSKLVTSVRKSDRSHQSNEENENVEKTFAGSADADDGESSDEENVDGDTTETKSKSRHNQDLEYEEPEPEENPDDPDEIEEEAEQSQIKEEVMDEEDALEDEMKYGNADVACDIPIKQETEDLDKAKRIKAILNKFPMIYSFDYDSRKMLWCEFTIQLALDNSKVDLKTVIEDETSTAILYRVPNINKAFVVKKPNSFTGEKMLKTDGVNFLEIFGVDYMDTIDTSKAYSNDIHAIAKIFGIEAAARVIVKEITNVFGIYGIEVDPRHLLLIADYMTFDGTYKPCNRIGMASNASPLQQMTFETTMSFLQNAALTGSEDQLKSPSSKLIVGQLVSGGTGSFDLFLKPPSEFSVAR